MVDSLRKWYANDGAAQTANPANQAGNPQKSKGFPLAGLREKPLTFAKPGTPEPQKPAVLSGNSRSSRLAGDAPEKMHRDQTGDQNRPESPWVTCFHKRKAIAEMNGEAEAHRIAFWEAVQAWEAANPLILPAPGACVVCGHPVASGVAIEVKDGGTVYQAHGLCGQRLHKERRAAAVAALAAAGI